MAMLALVHPYDGWRLASAQALLKIVNLELKANWAVNSILMRLPVRGLSPEKSDWDLNGSL